MSMRTIVAKRTPYFFVLLLCASLVGCDAANTSGITEQDVEVASAEPFAVTFEASSTPPQASGSEASKFSSTQPRDGSLVPNVDMAGSASKNGNGSITITESGTHSRPAEDVPTPNTVSWTSTQITVTRDGSTNTYTMNADERAMMAEIQAGMSASAQRSKSWGAQDGRDGCETCLPTSGPWTAEIVRSVYERQGYSVEKIDASRMRVQGYFTPPTSRAGQGPKMEVRYVINLTSREIEEATMLVDGKPLPAARVTAGSRPGHLTLAPGAHQ